jgi:hypothetical protein
MKICTKCKIEKENSEFYKRTVSKDGLATRCKDCESKAFKTYIQTEEGEKKHKEWYLKNKDRIHEERMEPENKKKKSLYNKQYRENNPEIIKKNFEQFRQLRADWYQNNGKTPEARKKSTEDLRIWRSKNPEQSNQNSRRSLLKKKYDLTLEEYDLLFEQQDGKCAICGKEETAKHHNGTLRSLAVDHNHDTNQIRGLLCSKCNLGIGHFDEDIYLFDKIINYLLEYEITQDDIINNITN